jgi:sphingosine kinase
MAEAVQPQRAVKTFDSAAEESGSSLPPLKYMPDDEEGWITFDKPILFIYGGKGPYVSR